MSLLKIKPGVIVSRQVIIAAGVINAAQSLGLPVDMVITSGRDGTHQEGSLHYQDRALDFRTKHLSGPQKHALVRETARRLGSQHDVLLEAEGKAGEHMHCEYDPT